MKEFQGLPVYYINIDENDDLGMRAISIVDDPAIEKNFICYKKDFSFSKDDTKHEISGPAIIADVPLYRNHNGLQFYTIFDKDVIKKIVEKYSKENLWNCVDLQHDGNIVDNVICVEHFIKDSQKGIVPRGFEDVNDGSLFCTFKILDDNLWNVIKNTDNLNGFSIEIMTNLEERFSKENEVNNEDEELEELIKSYDGELSVVRYEDQFLEELIYSWEDVAAQIKRTRDSKIMSGDVQIAQIPNLNVLSEQGIKYAIDQHKVVMVTYDDDKDDPAINSRQLGILCWGYTKANNECIRVFETFGDSRHKDELPGWRILRLDRIKSFQILDFVEPWVKAPALFNPHGDESMSSIKMIAIEGTPGPWLG